MPLTFRHEALRITFLTAHKAKDAETVDWSTLTDAKMTVVVYMGMTAAPSVRAGLLAAGRSPQTPVGVFARVTRPDAQAAVGTLDQLPDLVRADRRRSRHSHHRRRGRAFRAMAPFEPQSSHLRTAGSCRMTSPLEQKKIRITGPSVVTANRTWDGVVIYRTARQDWSADLSDAAIVRTSDEARALLAESVADDVGAVGAYIAPVEVKDSGTIKPGNLREHIRLARRHHRSVGSGIRLSTHVRI